MSNILSKINKKRGSENGINISSEKQFLGYVRETMLDFKYALNNGSTDVSDILTSLNNILSSKKLTLGNVKELIKLIETGRETALLPDIEKEHMYMKNILLSHFVWQEYMGMYSISYRNQEVA